MLAWWSRCSSAQGHYQWSAVSPQHAFVGYFWMSAGRARNLRSKSGMQQARAPQAVCESMNVFRPV
ncbi:hypothetical protein E2C01_038778 [Portunus trituberculatus]|uniref:Uncharacterized protein n=1 Tax=Portunus trituberculatus TaxID=210409 RepID=A0A5B7FKZ4_PORTR|nr:hypothetical protein [Portunus trituberculatus]